MWFNWLFKLSQLKIHNNCPGELDDVVKQLEEGTGSVVVGKIGRTVILYRPSLSKMKAVEKKRAQRISFRKQSVEKQPQVLISLSCEDTEGNALLLTPYDC